MKRKRQSSSRKTSAAFSILTKDAISPRSSTKWPNAGSMRAGACSALTTPARPTSEKGSGYWPTARSTDGAKGSPGVALWRTPMAFDADKAAKNSRQESLTGQVLGWPTPMKDRGGAELRAALAPAPQANWPTPDAAVMNGENPASFLARRAKLAKKHRNGAGAGTPLAMAVKLWPSPQAQDFKSGAGWEHAASGSAGHSPQLRHLLGGLLNPDWVEQLMGWPEGWTLPPQAAWAALGPRTRRAGKARTRGSAGRRAAGRTSTRGKPRA